MSLDKTSSTGQPVGHQVEGVFPCPVPPHRPLLGRFGQLVPLVESHADGLFDAFATDETGSGWTYLPDDPWADRTEARAWCANAEHSKDPQFYTIMDLDGRALGFCSFLRIMPGIGSIEVGYIHFSKRMQKRPVATDVMYLMMKHVFELGYRRYEWKCDDLNAGSRRAAARLGFRYEGTFRQATIYKGRNRDTAWFSIIDSEWPDAKNKFEHWLAPSNFDASGQQRQSLQDFAM
ncbi:MAG: GNAT family N-acetyltransferase [Pelagimonas sp.]|uniref:GNAT family N-acetyltransferase n=1 Tax=Pelagimonas sp. TaxID=2073170 RepID=UPI003D6ADC48